MLTYKRDLSDKRWAIKPAAFDKPTAKKESPNRVLLIGFDTEFFRTSETENEVLSYQYAAMVLERDVRTPPSRWEGIVVPAPGKRISLPDLITIAASDIYTTDSTVVLPSTIYLVGHFLRADIPAFSEFKEASKIELLKLDSVRKTFINMRERITTNIEVVGGRQNVDVSVRDTLLLAAGGKSLADIGELVEMPKVILHKDPKKEMAIKKQMNALRADDWDLYREYAMTDARIVREYAVRLVRLSQELAGQFKIPITLSALGVTLLEKFWKDTKQDLVTMSGRETIKSRNYNKKKKRSYKLTERPLVKKLHYNEAFLTECFHGGRNEQFQFGPMSHGDWVDYDIKSAYLTAMAMVGAADWKGLKEIESLKELLSYKAIDLAFAEIDFEFQGAIKFPCLPVRTLNGLIFPLKGATCVPIAEVLLARRMGAKLKFNHGVFIPTDRSKEGRPFLDFAKSCLERRQKHAKGTLENAFWKEIVNSTYGKTAQSLMKKRVYDLRDRESKPLPASRITNPAYAAFISGFCRATVSEILDRLEPDTEVCSVTTDGFLSQAIDEEIELATLGSMGRWYREGRRLLGDDASIIEVKHRTKRVLGWRTRGQATLSPGKTPGKGDDIVIARSSIKTPWEADTDAKRNDYIVNLFLDRTPETLITESRFIGIREMYEGGLDLVERAVEKRLSMEYDWKRCPSMFTDRRFERDGKGRTHLWFDTVPHATIEDHRVMRERWESFNSNGIRCLKTAADMREWQEFERIQASPEKVKVRKYLRRKDPGGLNKLRRQVATAYKHAAAGLRLPDQKVEKAGTFAEWLNEAGIKCNRPNIYSDWEDFSETFEPHQVPRTDAVLKACEALLKRFPEMQVDQLLEPV